MRERIAKSEIVLFSIAFIAVHALLWWLQSVLPNMPLGDVVWTYRSWIDASRHGFWVGVDSTWVYPIGAVVPMLVAAFGGLDAIGTGWLLLMSVLDAAVCVLLWRYRSVRIGAARVRVVWWWLLFLAALGPISLARIDTVATAVALAGVAFVVARRGIASGFFAAAAWIKVWPAALVGVLLVTARRQRRSVLVGALVVTAMVVIVDGLFGGWPHLLSFVSTQAGRGLQIESPLATPFLWKAAFDGIPYGAFGGIIYDQNILTYQITGHGVSAAAAVSTPLMAAAVLAGAVVAVVAIRRGASRSDVAPILALLWVGVLIATNKVGSPQYIGWFAVPIVWGFIAGKSSGARFRLPAALALVAGVLTQLIYPAYYGSLLSLQGWMLVVITVRNLIEIAIVVWSFAELIKVPRHAGASSRALDRAGRIDP